MSYPVVIVIIIITAIVSYLIGMFDAKTTNKWFGSDKPVPESKEPDVKTDPKIKRLAIIQSNEENELFVEYDETIRSTEYKIDKLNKQKITELTDILSRIGEIAAPKTYVAQEKREQKEKLALQRSLISSVQKAPQKRLNEVTDLIGLINHVLQDGNDSKENILEIREDQDHVLSFWVDDKVFASVDEVKPTDARDRFKKAIDSVN